MQVNKPINTNKPTTKPNNLLTPLKNTICTPLKNPICTPLHVNTDVAAKHIAQAMQPLKVVYITSNGGIRLPDESGGAQHTLTLSLSLSLSHTLSHTLSHALSLSPTLSHAHSHTLSLSDQSDSSDEDSLILFLI